VLQRGRDVPVWGWADPGEKVRVRWGGATLDAVAGPDGAWRVTLPPQQASSKPADLVVTGRNTIDVRDVLVGDVWLCSGQSNMEFMVAQGLDAAKEIVDSDHPPIRHFKIPHTLAEKPARDVAGEWKACSPENVGAFSAVAFFFAREMWRRTGVPIGLVNSTWGGTQIEEWMSAGALAKDPAHDEIRRRWELRLKEYPERLAQHEKALAKWNADAAAAKARGETFAERRPPAAEGPGSRWEPAGMYNAMIAPLVPAAFAGVLWYQGEENAPRAGEYRTLFPGLVEEWRSDFGRPDLPFYFVQLANFNRPVDKGDRQWAFLREAQAGVLRLPRTGMAVTIDIGDPANIHPKDKQEAGRRLSLVARAQLLGDKVECFGPMYAGIAREGSALRVRFGHAAGLFATAKIGAFELAGADRRFFPADARIDGETVVVTSEDVAEPVAVRYAFRNAPVATLYNGAGLPAAPFRSDDWPENP
jgi:sialate O-acetylesterase